MELAPALPLPRWRANTRETRRSASGARAGQVDPELRQRRVGRRRAGQGQHVAGAVECRRARQRDRGSGARPAQTKVAKAVPFFAIVRVVEPVAAVPAVPELPAPPLGNEQLGGINRANSSVLVSACSAVKIKLMGPCATSPAGPVGPVGPAGPCAAPAPCWWHRSPP